ncbi:MAG: chromosomal replication initiator DnaA [Sphingomonas sp.]|uniref:DnaA ATPase domain-containing protein n=1 Tax=Sphingomonas sp. TaxID=28214 RepID=UPI001AD375AD|nr:DnaA/Hda family protein [Sphingomonas sp.]MBN8807376.1 chromosomal replication initiator DnaA [Sphingomonas sp.]
MSQLGLPLAWPPGPGDDDFLVTASNAQAFHLLERWATWPVKTALLVGPRKSGRSLLARLFATRSNGSVIDDADRRSEKDLFHAWNTAQADRRPQLFVAETAPPDWRVSIPDLRSRLAASPVATIGQPDDDLMHALLQRQFDRRQLDARPDLVTWLAKRLERSFVAIERAVDVLDQDMLERRKRLSIPRARATLADAGIIGPVDEHGPQ